jgi:hypothetical protein
MQRNRSPEMSRGDQFPLASRMRSQYGIIRVCESEGVLACSLVRGAALDEPEGRGRGLGIEGFS